MQRTVLRLDCDNYHLPEEPQVPALLPRIRLHPLRDDGVRLAEVLGFLRQRQLVAPAQAPLLLDFIQGNHLHGVKLLPFFSMVDHRKSMHLRMLEDLPRHHPEMLHTPIPYASEIERMGIHRAPVFGYARRSAGAQAYEAMWQEVKARL